MTRGPEPTVSDEEIRELVADAPDRFGRPVAGTAEIADIVGIARQNAGKRLQRLSETGDVIKDKVGPAAIWWVEENN